MEQEMEVVVEEVEGVKRSKLIEKFILLKKSTFNDVVLAVQSLLEGKIKPTLTEEEMSKFKEWLTRKVIMQNFGKILVETKTH